MMTKKSYCLLLILSVLAIALSGCAGPLTQANFDARESYRSPQFKDGLKGAKAALLTAAIDSGSDYGEYRKILSDIVEEVIKDRRKDISVIPTSESLSVINQAGLTSDYSQMLKDYTPTGILNKDILIKLKNVIGVSFFIQPKLIYFAQRDTVRLSILGLTTIKTQEAQITVYVEIWSADTGEILWVGVGDATKAAESVRSKPVPFEDVARLATEQIIQKLP